MSATAKLGKRQRNVGDKPKPPFSSGECEKKPEGEDPAQEDPIEIPTRNLEKLYCSSVTIHCALQNHCVPCGYKICCFDVALDTAFSKMVPNQRPEQCPRSKGGNPLDGVTLGYQSGMQVLTVGDGDFSFSLAVARLLSAATTSDSKNKKKMKPIHLVATSYESKETLCRVYPDFAATASELESLGAILCYQVDATRLKDTLPSTVTTNNNDSASLFHRIIWNFPCTAIDEGQDGQNDAMEKNKQLVRTFVENARRLVVPDGGEIHMCHKTKPPFNQWKIEQVALELCHDEPSVVYNGHIVLDKCLLPPYQPRKALHSKSFPCHDACFYVFRVLPNGVPTSKKAIETIPESLPKYSLTGETKDKGLVPVTRELVMAVRQNLLEQSANKRNKRRDGPRQQKRRRR